MNEIELSVEEQAVWDMLVENGRVLRAPLLEAKAQARAENRAELMEKFGRTDDVKGWRAKGKNGATVSESVPEVPTAVKRFMVARASGISFGKAAASSGVRWVDISFVKARNEEMRCAMAGLDEASRDLIRAKSVSVIEQGLEEGTRPYAGQLMIAENMLKRLDVDHYGDYQGKRAEIAEAVKKELTGGGFVVNLIGDAAQAASDAPKAKPEKAVVYADV